MLRLLFLLVLPRNLSRFAVCLLVGLGMTGQANARIPNVVVSIAPLHSLVSAVMQGVATPTLIIEGGQSPHGSRLKPSAYRNISNADLLVWIGPQFESGMRKAVAQAHDDTAVIELLGAPELMRLPGREAGLLPRRSRIPQAAVMDPFSIDPHLWLAPENAIQIVTLVAEKLQELDPANALSYRENAQNVIAEIEKTRAEIHLSLSALKQVPYLVFHDAYQYFEQSFGVYPVAAVTINPERKPGAKSIAAMQKLIIEKNVQCLFSEPQFEPRLLRRLAEDSGARIGQLDPLGADFSPGPGQWFNLMGAMRDALQDCLSAAE